ncbi:MAG: radical SAM protein [Acidobacteria bacterium]|nr:radical SAM protein [Acidobacteriota bacterium]
MINGFIQCSLFRSDEPRPRLAGRIRRLSESMAASKAITKQFLLVPENEDSAARDFLASQNLNLEVAAGPHHPFSRFAHGIRSTDASIAVRFSSASDPIPGPIIRDMIEDHLYSGLDVTFPRTIYYDGTVQCQVVNRQALERGRLSPKFIEERTPTFAFPIEIYDNLTVNYFEPRIELMSHLPNFAKKIQDQTRYPVMVKIDPSETCNLRCNMCHFHAEDFSLGDDEAQNYYRDFSGKRNLKGTLSEPQFQTILDHIEEFGVPTIDLYSNGEPLMNKAFPRFLDQLAGMGRTVNLSSNGNLLNDHAIESIIDSGVSFLTFSIDALRPETYSQIRIGGDLGRVERNIDRLLEKRAQSRSKLKVGVNLTLQEKNREEAAPFVEHWISKADQVEILHYYAAKRYQMKKNWIPRARTLCHQIYVNLGATVRGELWMCIGGHHFESTIGDIFKNDLDTIIRESRYRQFQQDHIAARFEKLPMCASCEVWMKDLRHVRYEPGRVVDVTPVTRTYRRR